MELIYTPKAGNDLLRIKERIEEYFDDEEKRMNHVLYKMRKTVRR